MTVLRGQSSHSSWFFVESARIGDINANVTIALTSSILAARHGGAAPEISSGLFRRFIGTSGFQLINVNNVPLSLRSWSMDTRLIGRKALTNSLLRHYLAQAISEAHKVVHTPLQAQSHLQWLEVDYYPELCSPGDAVASQMRILLFDPECTLHDAKSRLSHAPCELLLFLRHASHACSKSSVEAR